MANLDRVKAQDTIHRGDYDPADWRGIYGLYLTAFGDKKLAEEMRTRAIEVLLERLCRRGR